MLNTFSFTCGAGVAALAGGATSVTNVDFSASALEIGRRNAVANGLAEDSFECLCGDALPAMRMLAGLPAKQDRRQGRGGRGGGRSSRRAGGRGGVPLSPAKPLKLRRKEHDIVVLDPPTWTTTKHGAVDLVRDYQSLFKPCVLACRAGGTVLAVNHVHSVDVDEWVEKLERCAKKADKPLESVTVLPPESDFPSPDGKPPLKMAIAKVADWD